MAEAGVRYVSKSGSDSNDGSSWERAKATIPAAISAVGGSGKVFIGKGTWGVSALAPNDVWLIGTGWNATTLQVTSGVGLNYTNRNSGAVRDLTLGFASGASGKLLDMNNSFKVQFHGVRFLGQNGSGQIGAHLRGNTGDCFFEYCKWESLETGILNETTVNYLNDCIVSSCKTGVKGGDPNSDSPGYNSGIVIKNTTFLGTSERYIYVSGKADTWMVSDTWFDGHPTIASIEVGANGRGPNLISIRDIPYTAAPSGVKNIVINASRQTLIDGVRFGNGSGSGVELTVNATSASRGHLGVYSSAQGTDLRTKIPATWTRLG